MRVNEEKKKKKEEEKMKKKEEDDKKKPAKKEEAEEEKDPTKYRQNRMDWLETVRKSGVNPYPHKFHTTHRNCEFVKEFGPLCTE